MTSFRQIEPDDVKVGMFIKVTEIYLDEDQDGAGPVRMTYEGEVTKVNNNPDSHILLAHFGPYAAAYLRPPTGGGVTVENLMVRLPDLPTTNGSVIRYVDEEGHGRIAVRLNGRWFDTTGDHVSPLREAWLVEHLDAVLFDAAGGALVWHSEV